MHRLVLAAHSPVFNTMLNCDAWKESKERKMTLENIRAKPFEILLRHLYMEKTVQEISLLSLEEIYDLIFLADKYNIDELKSKIEFLLVIKKATDQDRLEQWTLADRHNLIKLKLV